MGGPSIHKQVSARWEALKKERSSWMSHWSEISDYLLPRSGRFFVEDRNKGNKRHKNIYDNTGTRALRVLAAGMMFLPFWYIKLTAGHYRKAVTAELETALSIITTAYLRSEDLQTAVEENINYLNPPVQGVFRSFLTRIKHIDPDMNAALAELKSAIDNEVWREWCEALSACQYDHSMKSTLNPIVAKLSDMRIINCNFSFIMSFFKFFVI